jgi:two-component system, OmpR family, phosphate regulon sensor histidine kinase PhoR
MRSTSLFWNLLLAAALTSGIGLATLAGAVGRYSQAAVVWGVAIWLGTLLLQFCTFRYLLRQLSTITASAEALAEGDAGPAILSAGRSDELGRLASALNDVRARRLDRLIELREKSELLLSVLENMVEGVVAVGADETVLLANEASGRLLGFAAAHATGRPLVEVTRCRPLYSAVRQASHSGRPTRSEFESPGESRRLISVRAAPLAGDRRQGVMVVMHDVSELRRLENLRREFVANVSHELKTPLASIKAYAETLRLGAIDDDVHRMQFIERIEEQAERLHELIVDLLQLARVESGQEVFEFADLPLAPLVEECVEQFFGSAGARQITLGIAPDLAPLNVHVDEEGLRTIVNNLVDNALKYTPPEGSVRVSWRREGGYAVLSVQDTGIGIAPRDQGRIFERFFRVDKARSRELGGTGLGLSIVKHLAQAFGGDVAVESQEGAGSTFRVKLPLSTSTTVQAGT